MTTDSSLAPFARDTRTGPTDWYLGHAFTFLATGADPDGRLALIRFRTKQAEIEALILLTPAGLEDYFRHPELSEPAAGDEFPPMPRDPGIYMRSAQILPEYGVEMPPPPAMEAGCSPRTSGRTGLTARSSAHFL